MTLGVLVALLYPRITEAGTILIWHAVGALLIVAFACFPGLPGARLFRHWYPLPYVFITYRTTSLVIPALWPSIGDLRVDAHLAAWDSAIWGANPTVWLERIQTPLLTELLQICYALFLPAVLALAVALWFQKRYDEFRKYAFLLALGFLVSYVGYLIVPARGPRFFLEGLQTQPLRGQWLGEPLRGLLDRIESAHYDCFPSGHVEMTILALWWSRRVSPKLTAFYVAYACCMVLATTYLRYHYTVDLAAGAVVAAAALTVAPRLMERWE